MLGPTAEKVVRHARCPVLTVAQGREVYRDRPDFKKVLVPFDFSRHSIGALQFAETLADRYKATIQVLYVVSPRPRPSFIEVEEELTRVAEQARRALEKILDEEGAKNLKPRVDIGTSDSRASGRIVRYAEKHDFDLIVMASHGLAGIEHALLGSTTERVVRMATCPVLVLPGETMRQQIRQL